MINNNENLRVQFEDFTLEHFKIAPIWEFAIDEEGEEGQDETTLKPRLDLEFPDASEGLLIIECDFETKSGKKYKGLCSPTIDGSLGSSQPYLIFDNQFVTFWYGVIRPEREEIENIYKLLDETPDSLFPLSFISKLPQKDGTYVTGNIEGFLWFTFSNDTIYVDK